MRMTRKGQVTIPAELRERFGIRPGDEVEVVAGDAGVLVRRAERSAGRGGEIVARLRDRADGDIGADALLRLTRGE